MRHDLRLRVGVVHVVKQAPSAGCSLTPRDMLSMRFPVREPPREWERRAKKSYKQDPGIAFALRYMHLLLPD